MRRSLLLLLQSVTTDPTSKYDVVVADPIAPAWTKYVRCLGNHSHIDGTVATYEAMTNDFRLAIQSCSDVKASTMLQADAALAKAPDFQSKAKREAAIFAAFDGYEQSRLRLFEDLHARPATK